MLNERGDLAAAHDAAQINGAQWAHVRLAGAGACSGALCVERKQPDLQEARDRPSRPDIQLQNTIAFPLKAPKSFMFGLQIFWWECLLQLLFCLTKSDQWVLLCGGRCLINSPVYYWPVNLALEYFCCGEGMGEKSNKHAKNVKRKF